MSRSPVANAPSSAKDPSDSAQRETRFCICLEACLSDQQLRLFGAGRPVSMPPRARPALQDFFVMARAATVFATKCAHAFHAPVDELAADIVSCGECASVDEAVEERLRALGYAMDRRQRDALGEWKKTLDRVHEELVRQWVEDTCPSPPFPDVARVQVKLRHGREASGVAYRSPECESSATCLFVEDSRLADFLGGRRGDAYIGGAVTPWEDILCANPATSDDRRRYESYFAEERALDRRIAYEQAARPRHESFDRTARMVAKGMIGADPDDIEAEIKAALARLSAQKTIDPESTDAAFVVGALYALRGRRFETDFELSAKETAAA